MDLICLRRARQQVFLSLHSGERESFSRTPLSSLGRSQKAAFAPPEDGKCVVSSLD